jgi:hypothetical protein
MNNKRAIKAENQKSNATRNGLRLCEEQCDDHRIEKRWGEEDPSQQRKKQERSQKKERYKRMRDVWHKKVKCNVAMERITIKKVKLNSYRRRRTVRSGK